MEPAGVPDGASVSIEDPRRMNLLGLILADIFDRALHDPDKQRRYRKLVPSVVVVRAGEMAVTLHFEQQTLQVSRGAAEQFRARVEGPLDALLALSLGGGMVGPWLAGRLKTRGSLLLLLRLRPLLQV